MLSEQNTVRFLVFRDAYAVNGYGSFCFAKNAYVKLERW